MSMPKWITDAWTKMWSNILFRIAMAIWAAFWAADVVSGGVLSDAVRGAPEAGSTIAAPPAQLQDSPELTQIWQGILGHEHAPRGMDTVSPVELEALLAWWAETEGRAQPAPGAPVVRLEPRIEIHPPSVPLQVQVDFPTPVEPREAPRPPPPPAWPGWLR